MEQLDKAILEYETRLNNYKMFKAQISKQNDNYFAVCCSIVDTEDDIKTLKRAKRLMINISSEGE